MTKRTNEYGFEEFEGGHGKKQNQKLKPYLVLQYLLRQSDEKHVVSAENIVVGVTFIIILAISAPLECFVFDNHSSVPDSQHFYKRKTAETLWFQRFSSHSLVFWWR